MKKTIDGKTVLITGASSGIGRQLALDLAADGAYVVLVARRKDRLLAVQQQIEEKGGSADIRECDLADRDARQGLTASILAEGKPIDILINNAGFGWYGYFHKMAWSDAARMLAVNVEAAAHLTRLILPEMLREKRGHVINISSIAGGLPNQGIAVYAASKAFLDAFSASLYRELRGSGVFVSAMRLGPVKTEFYDQAVRMENGEPVPAERFAISTERVNASLWRLLNHPRRVVYVPAWLCLSRWVDPLFSGLIDLLGPLLLRRRERP